MKFITILLLILSQHPLLLHQPHAPLRLLSGRQGQLLLLLIRRHCILWPFSSQADLIHICLKLCNLRPSLICRFWCFLSGFFIQLSQELPLYFRNICKWIKSFSNRLPQLLPEFFIFVQSEVFLPLPITAQTGKVAEESDKEKLSMFCSLANS